MTDLIPGRDSGSLSHQLPSRFRQAPKNRDTKPRFPYLLDQTVLYMRAHTVQYRTAARCWRDAAPGGA